MYSIHPHFGFIGYDVLTLGACGGHSKNPADFESYAYKKLEFKRS